MFGSHARSRSFTLLGQFVRSQSRKHLTMKRETRAKKKATFGRYHSQIKPMNCCFSTERNTNTAGPPTSQILATGRGGVHDVGGVTDLFQPLDLSEKKYSYWERKSHALLVLLVSRQLITTDELRRAVEALPVETYASYSYYAKWGAAMATIMLERGVVTPDALDKNLGTIGDRKMNRVKRSSFKRGDVVRVLPEDEPASRWRKPHLRVPGYIFEHTGVIERFCGEFGDPEFLAFRGTAEKMPLYRVRFLQRDIWQNAAEQINDTIDVDVYQSWLEPLPAELMHSQEKYQDLLDQPPMIPPHAIRKDYFDDPNHRHSDRAESDDDNHIDQHHSHNHSHHHLDRSTVEQNAIIQEGMEDPGQRIVEALTKTLLEQMVISADELRNVITSVDELGSTASGPRLVARAWLDPKFKQLLLTDAPAACAELGLESSNSTTSTLLTVVENTKYIHNVVVCTLCSCYPLSILGLSPPWYKDRRYRARIVKEPRRVLREEFGTFIPTHTAVRVHDSTADLRYFVLPERPRGTENWTEDQLQKLVTRDSLIGVAKAKPCTQ